MNGYIGIWNGKQFEINAETSYKAQQILVPIIQATTRKKVKSCDVSIHLTEKDGKQVIHTPIM